jgi:glucokinase
MIILGSSASGKTTLAHRLAAELSVPVLSKDDIKEALFDVLGVADREGSKRLSDASFAAQLRLAQTQLDAGLSCMIEGNWRSEHAAGVLAIIARTHARPSQVWCRANPDAIARRFASRVRHPGHLDAAVAAAEIQLASEQPPSFMDLPGPRWVYDSDDPHAYGALVRELIFWRL